jgi:hypothetical protein
MLHFSLKPVLHLTICGSTCCLRAKNGQIARHSQGARAMFFTPQTTRKKEFWHDHNFLRAPCNFRFAVIPQGTCTKKECYPCNLIAHVASLKWGVRGEMLRDTYLCLNFQLHSPCQACVKWVQLTWLVLVKCVRRLACKRDSRGKNTLYSTWYQCLSFEGQL